jgi:hypothetical protein
MLLPLLLLIFLKYVNYSESVLERAIGPRCDYKVLLTRKFKVYAEFQPLGKYTMRTVKVYYYCDYGSFYHLFKFESDNNDASGPLFPAHWEIKGLPRYCYRRFQVSTSQDPNFNRQALQAQ